MAPPVVNFNLQRHSLFLPPLLLGQISIATGEVKGQRVSQEDSGLLLNSSYNKELEALGDPTVANTMYQVLDLQ